MNPEPQSLNPYTLNPIYVLISLNPTESALNPINLLALNPLTPQMAGQKYLKLAKQLCPQQKIPKASSLRKVFEE